MKLHCMQGAFVVNVTEFYIQMIDLFRQGKLSSAGHEVKRRQLTYDYAVDVNDDKTIEWEEFR